MLSREGYETGAPNDGLLKSRENDHSLLLKYKYFQLKRNVS